jgi:putative ABC transport system permease protein
MSLASLATVSQRIVLATASSKRIFTRSNAGNYLLPMSYEAKISTVPHVVAVSAWTGFGGIYRDSRDQFANFAVEPATLTTIWPEWDLTREVMTRFMQTRMGCLAGEQLMKKYNWKVGDQIILRTTLDLPLQIVGTLGPKGPATFLLFRFDYAVERFQAFRNSVHDNNDNLVGGYRMTLDSPRAVPQTIGAIDRLFASSPDETITEAEDAVFLGLISGYDNVFAGAKVLGVIVLIAVALVAANTASMSFRERRVEVAVLRALGYEPGRVFRMLLTESAAIGALGGLLGSAITIVLLRGLGPAIPGLPGGYGVPLPEGIHEVSFILATAIGAMAALVPARSAARSNISASLRAV